ncbi:MAG TPA: hypothetical protein VF746_12515 [Longimicrobium sp.]|jgi:hypothetical protein
MHTDTLPKTIRPFGHVNAEEDDLLVEAFHHVPHAELATDQETTILVGRRGAGKTALGVYLKRLRPDLYSVTLDIDKKKALAQVILAIDTALKESRSTSSDLMADLWTFVIWTKTAMRLCEHPAFAGFEGREDLKVCLELLGIDDRAQILAHLKEFFGRPGPDGARPSINQALLAVSATLDSEEFQELQRQIRRFLDQGNDILAVIDTIEDYRVREPSVDQALAGLLAAVSAFGGSTPHPRFHVKCFFPAEIYPYITTARAVNLRKIDQRLQHLKWTPRQLFVMLCRRLAAWLEAHLPETFDGMSTGLDWRDLHAVRERVWTRVFPPFVKNRRGMVEESFLYIARHTHLHPGHLIWMCNRIAQLAREAGAFPPVVAPEHVVAGVRNIESEVANSIMAPYRAIYPNIHEVVTSAFRQSPPILRISDALRLYRKAAQVWPREYIAMDDWTLITMAAEVGAIGKVRKQTSQYHVAQFRYHMDAELTFEKDDLCAIHPAFYRLFETTSDPADSRTVCPIVITDEADDD